MVGKAVLATEVLAAELLAAGVLAAELRWWGTAMRRGATAAGLP
jgi:hypothetical protein